MTLVDFVHHDYLHLSAMEKYLRNEQTCLVFRFLENTSEKNLGWAYIFWHKTFTPQFSKSAEQKNKAQKVWQLLPSHSYFTHTHCLHILQLMFIVE